MLAKLVIVAAVIAAAYWYWTGPYQQNQPSSETRQLQENARNMKKCMRAEKSMGAAAGMAGVGGVAGDAQTLCAQRYNLYLQDGQWHSQ